MNTNMDESDFYKLINVSRTASEAEIRKAFRKRALELHPDKNPGSEEMMKRLTMAKDTLLDPDKRQKYNDEHEDMGTAQDISGFLHCGKRLSSRYKRKLVKYMADFDKLKIKDNFNVVFDTLANLNNRLAELVNTSIATASQDISTSGQANDTEALRSYFYEGRYMSMAKYLMDNQCDSSSISTLRENLTTGRDVSCTPLSFQAGLLLLKGQLSANERKHEDSLEAFQQAVFTSPSDEVISAVNILMGNSHLIAAIQVVIHQLLKGHVDIAQTHKYQDRLNRTNHLRLVSKFEKGVLQDTQTSNWGKAMMYIDLTMAASGIALIHCFFVAMTYLLEEMTKNEEEDVARVYAICNIICELATNVVVLARRCALPVTEMHFNKLSFIILRKAHETLKSKIKNYKISFLKKIFGPRRVETTLVTEIHIEMYKMMANSIYRLFRVSPFVDLHLTTVADMIYLDVISDQFVEEFYKSKIAKKGNHDKESWSHLYKYYLLECAWKTGNDSKVSTYREESMKGLLEKNAWSPEEVEQTMWWNVINRNKDGWLDITRSWLNLQGTNYDSVDGVVIDVERGTFRVLCTPSPPGSGGLFDDQDIVEVIYNGLKYSIFTLDPPDSDLHYHPFHQLKFSPRSLADTNLLQTLIHADYLLKMMSMGTEVSANAPHLFRSAFKNGFLRLLPTHLREKVKPLSERRGGDRKENVHRFWIESGVLEYKCEDTNDGKMLQYMLGPCQMQVKTHLMKHNSDGELVDDSEEEDESDEEDEEDIGNKKKPAKPKKKRITAETEFANDFTECYDKVGYYFPILLRLRELMKLVTVYGILSNIYDNLETAKKELNATLTTRFSKALKEMRKKIQYPQNNSSNVNKIYRSMLRDQGINESNLAAGEEDRAKREIRHQLDEVDEEVVVEVAKGLASSFEISNCSQFMTKVRKWLNDGLFTSYTKELVAYIVEQVYPREYEKLDRFAKNAASSGIRFGSEDDDDDKDDKDSGLSTAEQGECPWVPAVFCREDSRRAYGGVCLLPQLKNVTNFTSRSGNISFVSNSCRSSTGGSSGGGNNDDENRKGMKRHGNWHGSNRAQHIYEIHKHNPGGNLYVNAKNYARQHPTLVYKVGISNDVVYQRNREGMPDRVGNSVRAQRQTDRLNQIYMDKHVRKAEQRGVNQQEINRMKSYYRQNPVYTCRIVERIPTGEGARGIVQGMERSRIDRTCFDQQPVFGTHVVPGNREPATVKFKQQMDI